MNAVISLPFLCDLNLAEHATAGLVEHRHQMREPDPAVGGTDAGAAQGLAVQGQHAALFSPGCALRGRLGAELGQHPGLQRRLQRRGVDPLQDPADGRLVRSDRAHPSTSARARPTSWAYSAIAVNDRAPANTAHAPSSNTARTPWRTPRGFRGSGTRDRASTSDNPAASPTGAALPASGPTSRPSRAATIGDTDTADTGFLT